MMQTVLVSSAVKDAEPDRALGSPRDFIDRTTSAQIGGGFVDRLIERVPQVEQILSDHSLPSFQSMTLS
jgi:hypothetical protein